MGLGFAPPSPMWCARPPAPGKRPRAACRRDADRHAGNLVPNGARRNRPDDIGLDVAVTRRPLFTPARCARGSDRWAEDFNSPLFQVSGTPQRTRRRKAKTHLEIWSWAVGLCVIGIIALTAEHGGTLRTGCVVFILASVGAFQSYDLSRRRSAADGRLGGLNATRE